MRALVQPLANRFYYGWVVLGAVSVTEVVSWGILYYAFSVFVAPMQAELGWSQPAITGAFSLALLCSGVAAVPVGRWLDRHGPRALMTAGAIAGALLLVAWSAVQSLWAFYLVLAGIGLTMAAVLYEPAFAIIATWFRRKRGRALTVLTFFGAWASFVFIPLTSRLVEALGWRQALLALAAILACINILPLALLLRRRPQDLGLQPDGLPPTPADAPAAAGAERSRTSREALREPAFWWLSFTFAVSTFNSVALTVHFIPYLVSRGHTTAFAASVAGLFGLMSLTGRLLIGPLGDRFPRLLVTAGLMAMQAVGLTVLALAPTQTGALVYVALFGAGTGTMTIMRAALLAERYGPANFGSISGAQNIVLTGASTLAPLGAGLLATALGGYPTLLLLLAALSGAALVAVLRAGDR
ncbi:MAG: MFS transporter [Chloroflexota bacterium]